MGDDSFEANVLVKQFRRCERCGACCRNSIIDVDLEDALREPRIVAEATLLDGHGTASDDEWQFSLNQRGGKDFACIFLTDEGCSIYPTRPVCCIGTLPGGDRCTDARRMAGLPPIGREPELKDSDF